jgi:type I restriction enzyme S subunit
MHVVPFGSTCTLQNGRAFKPSEWSEIGTPIVRIQNLNDESKSFNYCNFEVEERFHIQTGDLLFSWSGTPGTSFGAFFWNRGKGFLNQHIFRVDVDESKVDKNYLRYAINSKLKFIIDQAHGGVGLKHITKGKLEATEIPLPPLAEQKRIADILDKADGIRRKRQQAIDLADEFLRATFLDMFGDPVTNPKRWKVSPLIKCAELINGDRSSNYPSGGDLVDSGVLFLNTKNITKGRLDYDKSTFITQEKFDSLGGGKLVRDDLVITMRGTLGSCALFDGPFETGFINAQLMIIRCNNSLKPLFLHSLLTSEVIHRKFQEMSRGAAVPQLTGAQMKE